MHVDVHALRDFDPRGVFAHQCNQGLVKAKTARSGNWFSVAQFTEHPFFRFNLAAKCHFRFVKQQLLAFNESLLGAWPDGAAYADDFGFATDTRASWQIDVLGTIGTIQRETKLRNLSEGMAVLTSEIVTLLDRETDNLAQLRAALAKLRDVTAALDVSARYTYGIRDGEENDVSTTIRGVAGADALKRIRQLVERLDALEAPFRTTPAARTEPAQGAPPSVVMMTFADWKSATSRRLEFRDSDHELTHLDSAYRYVSEWLGGSRTLRVDDKQAMERAEMLSDSCEAWLEAHTSASARRDVIARLHGELQRCLTWAAG